VTLARPHRLSPQRASRATGEKVEIVNDLSLVGAGVRRILLWNEPSPLLPRINIRAAAFGRFAFFALVHAGDDELRPRLAASINLRGSGL
jgi:hypothetical protein